MKRAGFTLTELLVVLMIIAILAAFLIPAVSKALYNAREAAVIVEMKSLESGLVQFRSRLGIDPPSFIVLYENGDGVTASPSWDNSSPNPAGITDVHRRTSRAFIRQMWPEFDFSYGGAAIDINDNKVLGDVLILNGAECLAFFLGGVPSYDDTNSDGVDDTWSLTGFSANPRSPFLRGGNRIGPFHEFDASRIIDIDSERGFDMVELMPEYIDSIPGQKLPMLYFSSYGGIGCKCLGLDYDPISATNPSTVDDETLPMNLGVAEAYYTQLSNGAPRFPSAGQFVSPGHDGEYGTGGWYNGEGVGQGRKPERDNIVNFIGRLN